MRDFEFSLAIPAEQARRIYAGEARFILVEDRQGLKLQLPAVNFRRYVDNGGIHGHFQVTIDNNNRIIKLRRRRSDPSPSNS